MHDHPKTRHPLWLLGIVFLALATSACGQLPVTGIHCIEEKPDGDIVAIEKPDGYWDRIYISRDGGLSWQSAQPSEPSTFDAYCNETVPSGYAWTLSDPSDPAVFYRFTPSVSIERLEDDGVTWRRDIDLSGTEARTIYQMRFRHEIGIPYRAVPSDSLVHTQTGNLIVAMGYEGTLLRTPQGEWSWVRVDRYQHVDIRDPAVSISLIWPELIMGLALAVLTINTLTLFSKSTNFWIVIGGIVLIYVSGFLVYLDPYYGLGISGALLLSVPIAIVGLIVAAIEVSRLHWTSLNRLIPTFIFGSIPFLIFAGVYFLWARGGIALHQMATVLAWGLVLVNLFVGIWVLRRFPSPGQPSDWPVDRAAMPEPPA